MKIAILSSHFPPSFGGVSDHSFHLVNMLVKLGHEVRVYTATDTPVCINNVTYYHFTFPLNKKESKKIIADIKYFIPNKIFFQYTPLMWAPKHAGVSFAVVSFFNQLSKLKSELILITHEAYYPLEATLRGLILFPIHVLKYFFIAKKSSKIFFSHQALLSKIKKLLPNNEMQVVPIFSNFEKSGLMINQSSLDLTKTDVLKMGYFGGTHSTIKCDYFWEIIKKIKEQRRDFIFYFAGTKKEDWPNIPSSIIVNCIFLGRLDQNDVGQFLNSLDLLLLPYDDGINTRRGTLMAGLSYGVTILTTVGKNTRNNYDWDDYCYLVEAANKEKYIAKAVDIIKNFDRYQIDRKKIMDFYTREFSLVNATQSYLS